MIKKIVPIGLLAVAFAGPAWARTSSAGDAATLLNKANQMNYEEQETAKIAHSKAGDNQALMTYADTWATKGVTAWDEWWDMPISVGDLLMPILGCGRGEISLHQNVTITQAIIASCFTPKAPRNP